MESNSSNIQSKDCGQVIAQRDGAILVQCGDGALWLSHLKKNKLKLPAVAWLKNRKSVPMLPEPRLQLAHGTYPSTFQVNNQYSQTPFTLDTSLERVENGAKKSKLCENVTLTGAI